MSLPSTPPVKEAAYKSASRNTSQSFHPYMIHSTSSSLLTRSNSSPTQPLDSYARHRPSRSMSSLTGKDVKNMEAGGESAEDRRRSLEASRPAHLRRSGTLPAFPPSPSDLKKLTVTLPANPKLWTPSELATYLVHTLTTGGEQEDGHTLPSVLVEDIRTWVLRQQVNGRAFLRGGKQGWGNPQRPPPFLPLLLSLSRKLRRATLQGRILTSQREPSVGSADALSPNGDYAGFYSSTLYEEGEGLSDEGEPEQDDEDQVIGVKKLVKDFDMRGSASEASGDEEVVHRRASFSTEWRKDAGVTGRRREDSSLSAGGLADGEMSPRIGVRVHALQAQLTGGSQTGEEQRVPQIDLGLPVAPSGTSPPPPYASPNLDNGDHDSPSRRGSDPQMLCADSTQSTTKSRSSPSPTPTPPRPHLSSAHSSTDVDALTVPEESPHMLNMQTHERSGSNPYFALRRSTSSSGSGQGPRLPTLASLRENAELARADMAEFPDSDDERRSSTPSRGAQAWEHGSIDGEDSRWTTARRVTLRPNPAKGLFEAPGEGSPPEASRAIGSVKREKRVKEVDMDRKMSQLHARIRELEERLQGVEAEKMIPGKQPTSSILDVFGLSSGSRGDGLPSGIKGLPAYLFLVGIGVGVVVVKVLLGRKR